LKLKNLHELILENSELLPPKKVYFSFLKVPLRYRNKESSGSKTAREKTSPKLLVGAN